MKLQPAPVTCHTCNRGYHPKWVHRYESLCWRHHQVLQEDEIVAIKQGNHHLYLWRPRPIIWRRRIQQIVSEMFRRRSE